MARSLPGAWGKETTVMLMLVWLENHLIVLGLVAIIAGLIMGAALGRAQRKVGRITAPRRPSAPSSGVGRSRTTGSGSVSPRYQTRSW